LKNGSSYLLTATLSQLMFNKKFLTENMFKTLSKIPAFKLALNGR